MLFLSMQVIPNRAFNLGASAGCMLDIRLYMAYIYSTITMLLHLSDVSSEPLHGQISRQIRAKILAGDLAEGSALPSIRAMAREQHVSVITIKRSYEDLERDGLIYSKRGKGFFVAQLSDKQKQEMALEGLQEHLDPILMNGIAAGLTSKDIRQAVQKILRNRGAKK